ncbi:MAG TPA: hypothetical protein VK035_06190 [Kiloniellales bacterium]|nr:hypothetical protein [Kiloniellales bacterium]
MARRLPRRLRCLSCGAPIGRYRASCPTCGAAQPQKRIGSTIGLLVLILGLLVYTLYAILGEPA